MAKDKEPKPKKVKKQKEPTQLERINEKALNEHERLLNKLNKCDPNSDEYDAVLKELKEFESIQREKEKVQNSSDNSKREHIGKTLIQGGVTLLSATALMGLEKGGTPIVGKTASTFVASLFKRH